jgi:sporulation protein YlmC with PRC-barrel domain
MKSQLLGTACALLLASGVPSFAQKAPDPKASDVKKIEVPKDVFYAGLGPTQYLAKSRLIGQTAVDKSGAKLGVVDDVILGSSDNKIDGLIVDVGGGKKLGVRITAAKIETKDGKTTVTLPLVTPEIVKVLPAFGAKK